LVVSLKGERWPAGRLADGQYDVAELLAFVSQYLPLRAGDVIGTGCFKKGSATAVGQQLGFGEPVSIELEGMLKLSGRAVRGPALGTWRERGGKAG